jgi:hypothetical protein
MAGLDKDVRHVMTIDLDLKIATPFESHVGTFSVFPITRRWLQAKYLMTDAIMRHSGTLDAMTKGLDQFLCVLYFDRSDALGVRYRIPSLMIRLGQDQDCYDFIRWWEATPEAAGNPKTRFQLVKRGDLMEKPTFIRQFPFLVACLLLKVKILQDIVYLKISRKVLSKRMPAELCIQISKGVIQSPASARFVGLATEALTIREGETLLHCHQIAAAIVRADREFLPKLLDCSEAVLSFRPVERSVAAHKGSATVMRDAYPAWQETPGAFDLMRKFRACAARALKSDMNTYAVAEARGIAHEQVIRSGSANRVFQYTKFAIQDCSYLGLRETRPSERAYRRMET